MPHTDKGAFSASPTGPPMLKSPHHSLHHPPSTHTHLLHAHEAHRVNRSAAPLALNRPASGLLETRDNKSLYMFGILPHCTSSMNQIASCRGYRVDQATIFPGILPIVDDPNDTWTGPPLRLQASFPGAIINCLSSRLTHEGLGS